MASMSVRVGGLPGIRRLPAYLGVLRHLREEGLETISATSLARRAGHPAAVVKKDIEMTGAAGKTGVGYELDSLVADIESFLGWNNPHEAFLVGMGNLGTALLGYDGFRSHGLDFVAAFDSDPEIVGRTVHGVTVLPLGKLRNLSARMGIRTAVMTVPAPAAQPVADLLVAAGIKRIWSFAPAAVSVPGDVVVQREDLSAGWAELLVRSRQVENGSG